MLGGFKGTTNAQIREATGIEPHQHPFDPRKCWPHHGKTEQCSHRAVSAKWLPEPGPGSATIQCQASFGF